MSDTPTRRQSDARPRPWRVARWALLVAVAVGCRTSNRFQVANIRPEERAMEDAAIASVPPPKLASSPPISPPLVAAPIPSAGVPAGAPTPEATPPNPAGAGEPIALPIPTTPELVGKVFNPSGRPVGGASVQVVETGADRRVVAETASNEDGVFRVSHLRSGATYQIIASLGDRGQPLRGSTVASPPNGNVIVQLDEGGGSRYTPLGNEVSSAPPAPVPPVAAAAPAPVRLDIRTPRLQAYPPSAPAAPMTMAAATTPAQPQPALPSPAKIALPATPRGANADGPALVAVGLDRATLLDPAQGVPMALGNLQGDLILLDFWGSWCGPCRRSIPKLNALHRRYAGSGLTVVGVACEHGGSVEAASQAQQARRELGLEYTLLACSLDEDCPARDRFGVQSFPTIILLNRQGKVLFQGVGADAATFRRLERVIDESLRQVAAR